MEWEYLHHVSRLPFVWLPVSENAVIKASFTNEALPRLTLRVFVRYCRCVLKTPSSEGEQIYDTKKRENFTWKTGRPRCEDYERIVFGEEHGVMFQDLSWVPFVVLDNIFPGLHPFPASFSFVALQNYNARSPSVGDQFLYYGF